MIEQLGRIPKPNEHPQVKVGGLSITVTAMDERRISQLLVEKDPVSAPAAPEDAD